MIPINYTIAGGGLIMGLIEKLDWTDYGDIDTEYRREPG